MNRTKNVIFIEAPKDFHIQKIADFFRDVGDIEQRLRGEWFEGNHSSYYGDYLTLKGIQVTRFRKTPLVMRNLPEVDQVRTFSDASWFGDLVNYHAEALAKKIFSLAARRYRFPDTVVVSSGSIPDLLIASAANLFLSDFPRNTVAVYLEFNSKMINYFKFNTLLKHLKTSESFGVAEAPDNVGISDALYNFLFAKGQFDIDRIFTPEAAYFLRRLGGQTFMGLADMVPKIMPYLSGIIFYEESFSECNDAFMIFQLQTTKMEIVKTASDDNGSLPFETIEKILLQRGNEEDGNGPKVLDRESLNEMLSGVKRMKFDPNKVALYLSGAVYHDSGLIISELVRRDMFRSFLNMEEVERAFKDIRFQLRSVEKKIL